MKNTVEKSKAGSERWDRQKGVVGIMVSEGGL